MQQRLLLAAGMLLCSVSTPMFGQWYEVTDQQQTANGKMLWCTYNYKSIDERGQEITLSAYMQCGSSANQATGTIAEPLNQLVLAHHYTLFNNDDAPTNQKAALLDISGAGNQLFIVPDYQGFGASADRDQLYLIHDLCARQCYDALEAGKKLFDDEANVVLHSNWGLYLTGASQGAANAVATQRYIEQQELDEEWRLKGSLVAEGPYCPTGMLDAYCFDPDYQNLLMPLVLPLTFRSLWLAYPEELAAFEYTDCLSTTFNVMLYMAMNGADINALLDPITVNGAVNVSHLVSEELLNDTTALHLAVKSCLAKSDLDTGWTPRHAISGWGCSNDDVIPHVNNTRMATAFGAETFAVGDYANAVVLAGAFAQAYGMGADNKHQLACGLFLSYGSLLYGAVPYLTTMIPVQTETDLDAIQTTTTDEPRYDLYGRPVDASRQGFSVQRGRVIMVR